MSISSASARSRRLFVLRSLMASVGMASLGACGGGGSGGDAGPAAEPNQTPPPPPGPGPSPIPPAPGPSPQTPLEPPVPPAPAPSGARVFSLVSASTRTAPFCAGFVFRKGDIPANSGVSVSGASAQVIAKNTWPDGSLRFAIVAGTADLTANVPATVSLAAGTAVSGTPLSLSDLRATGVTAAVGCGSYGTVQWNGADWDQPFAAWVSGPLMSSWVYRKPVGSDAHLVAWLEVRLFAGGAVEVLPWVENGFINVASPTSKAASFSFILGGTQRYAGAIDLPSRTRTPLLYGTALSYWLGTDPGVVVKHDGDYLMSTGMVPRYGVTIDSGNPLVSSLPLSFTPLQRGAYREQMSGVGYHPSIGLLPQWDVLHLTCPAAATYGAVVRQGYSGGRYASHYRDENTHRPLAFSAHPNLSVNSSATGTYPAAAGGTAAPGYDTGHHPSIGYLAYLVTGRYYLLEELQFTATFNYLKQVAGGPYSSRNGPNGPRDGIFNSASGGSTVRGAAWSIRTLAQAAAVTPASDPLHVEFVASLEANITFNHSKYVAQPNNPFGIVQPYGSSYGQTDGHQNEAFWQQDFYTAAFGFMLATDPPIGSAVKTKLQAFFAWKARSVVGRLGPAGAGNWLYSDAASYQSEVAPTGANWETGAGPWPSSWGEMYGWNHTTSNTTDPGRLRGGNFPGAASYWGNMTSAIAYAVQHGADGASAAYQRLQSASNYPVQAADFRTAPEWAVAPAL